MTQTLNAMSLNTPLLDIAGELCTLKGDWVVAALKSKKDVAQLKKQLNQTALKVTQWDLRGIRLDHIWAEVLWRLWENKVPAGAELTQEQVDLFSRLEKYKTTSEEVFGKSERDNFFANIGFAIFRAFDHISSFTQLLGQFILDCFRVLKEPRRAPWRDFAGQVLRMGAQALPITGLVGLLIGVVIVYLMSGLLSSFGLELYIVNMIGIISIRELGPLLAAILVAGRSGSTITAQVGVMRLREELDAMHVLGISASFRLVFPRVLALALVMPFVALWTSLLAIFGGMLVAGLSIGVTHEYFIQTLPTTVHIGNVWMSLGKSAVFGILIALIGCHFGLRVKSDTESLGNGTTASVVASITAVILADAVFAILCRDVPIMP